MIIVYGTENNSTISQTGDQFPEWYHSGRTNCLNLDSTISHEHQYTKAVTGVTR